VLLPDATDACMVTCVINQTPCRALCAVGHPYNGLATSMGTSAVLTMGWLHLCMCSLAGPCSSQVSELGPCLLYYPLFVNSSWGLDYRRNCDQATYKQHEIVAKHNS